MNTLDNLIDRADKLDLIDPELILSHEAFKRVDSPTNADIQDVMINVQAHLIQVDKNHTVVLRHQRMLHAEHIQKTIEIMHLIAEIKTEIKTLQRHTSTELWSARLSDLFEKENQLADKISKYL